MKNKINNIQEEKNEINRFITGYNNDLYFWSIFLNLPEDKKDEKNDSV